MPWKKNTRTEIVHIVVTGYQKKKMPSKYYVFVVDVTWNNSERFEVYRRYSDFFSFQTTLKALFPGAAGRRNPSDRVIPQLPKRIFVGRSHVARVAEARLEQINRYCQTLISLDPKISESAHVVGFFSPRIGDKQLPKLHLHRPASLHPEKVPLGSLFEEYCALAEYVAEDNSQVSFKPGDKVLVMSKDESGWWMCGVDGRVGWAPPSYLKKCEDDMGMESDDSDEDPTDQKGKDSDDSGLSDSASTTPASSINSLENFSSPKISAQAYRAIDSYQADGPGQVSFEIGDTIHVLDKLEDGWWFVSNGREEGWAPCSYLEGDKEEEKITNLEDIEKYYTVDAYKAEEEDEVSFERGLVLEVLQKSLDGWWVVRIDKTVGLAPATFLKKVETQEVDPTQSISSTSRKESPPSTSLSPISRVQQPPRKESVRQRASLRNKPGTRPAQQKFQPSSLLAPIPAEREQSPGPSPISPTPTSPAPTPPKQRKGKPQQNPMRAPPAPPEDTDSPKPRAPRPQQESRKKPAMPPQEEAQTPRRPTRPQERERPVSKEPRPHPKVTGPSMSVPVVSVPIRDDSEDSPEVVSDSDPEENYLNYTFQQINIEKMKKRRKGSGSESSMASSHSEENTPMHTAKRPVATPRRSISKSESRPPLPPKPEELRPPLPPRPTEVPKIRKYKSMDETTAMMGEGGAEPERPRQRPRKSEIKRAKNRARAAKNTPTLTVVDEDSLETMSNFTSATSRTTSTSGQSYKSTKSAPPDAQPKRRTQTIISDPATAPLLAAPNQKPRRKSMPEQPLEEPRPDPPPQDMPVGSLDEGFLRGGSSSGDVTEKLLKMIMLSDDPALKAALRDLMTSDRNITAAIQGNW